mgnify:CR=1 FL=1
MSRYRGERGNVAPLAVALCLVLVMTLGFLADCGPWLYGGKGPSGAGIGCRVGRHAWMPGQAASANTATMQARPCRSDCGSGQGARGGRGGERVVLRGARSGSRRKRADVGGGHAGGGGESLPFAVSSAPDAKVASSWVFSARPYAAQQVWRPDARICGVHRFGDGCGAGQGRFSAISALEGFPREIAEEAQARLGG